jgi:hypothetical protein
MFTKNFFTALLASAGLVLFLCSIGILNHTKNQALSTIKVANPSKSIAFPPSNYFNPYPYPYPGPPTVSEKEICSLDWKVKPYQNNMLEGQNQVLEVDAHNTCDTYGLKVEATLDAKDFNVNLPDRVFYLFPGNRKTIGWILEPSKTGQSFVGIVDMNILDGYAIISPEFLARNLDVSTKDLDTFKISVKSSLGLNFQLLQILSQLGVFLGPAITLPWWYEQWQKRKESKEAKTSPVTVSSLSRDKVPVGQKVKRTKNRH